jgi:transcriptional regulator with XRE-family HTH domain
MREQAGLTLAEAAKQLDKTKSALSRLETGQSKVDVHIARSMMDLYDRYDPDLLDLVRQARTTGWWVQYLSPRYCDRGFTGLETDASAKVELCLVLIPGLLQTEAYARAIYEGRLHPWTTREVENNVRLRMARQCRLTDREFPLDLVALIDESALRKHVGGAEVMRDQLRHLAKSADLPTVTVQVLPNSLGTHVGMNGAMVVLSYPDDDDPDVLYTEEVVGATHANDPEVVAAAKAVLTRLRSEALSQEESVALVERIADQL